MKPKSKPSKFLKIVNDIACFAFYIVFGYACVKLFKAGYYEAGAILFLGFFLCWKELTGGIKYD